ncbi:MAG: peptidoglycan DD-metalloendopeptidase family protein [Clostridiales Family XIII bacterium]|nr:peptidoglycan DD-metalloendopeptidase family protein [Clostridiales Family XIII bacterium]
MLHLITTEDATYEAPIPYKTDFTESDTLYQDQEKITSPGKDGRKYVVGEIIRIDGKDTNERNEIEVTVLQEPVAAKALRGTKPTPQTISTGEYILPIKDKDVTSLYGQRWGRTHEGIDFGADVGTPVYAADTGKVTSSGYLAGFGLCVEIDHGEGVTTLYAHLSESFVEVGEKVEQGDVIAKSGNTGYSTGPHLHFGIYIMGESVNPAPYLPDLTLAPYYSSSTNSGG